MSKKTHFSISIEDELLKEIDKRLGLVPRSRYIEYLLKEAFKWLDLREKAVAHCNDLAEILDLKHLPVDSTGDYGRFAVQKTILDGQQKVKEIKALLEAAF